MKPSRPAAVHLDAPCVRRTGNPAEPGIVTGRVCAGRVCTRCTPRSNTWPTSAKGALTCWSASRGISPPCARGRRGCPGWTSRSGTPRQVVVTAGSRNAPWRSSPWKLASGSPTPPKESTSCAGPAPSRRATGKRAKWRTETVYAICTRSTADAHPGDLARWLRGHWAHGPVSRSGRHDGAPGSRSRARAGSDPGATLLAAAALVGSRGPRRQDFSVAVWLRPLRPLPIGR